MTEQPSLPQPNNNGRIEGDKGTHDYNNSFLKDSDKDQPYNPKNFKTILTPREQAKLLIFKAKANSEVEYRRQLERIKTKEKEKLG